MSDPYGVRVLMRSLRLGITLAAALVAIGGAAWLRSSARAECDIADAFLPGLDLVVYGLLAVLVVGAVHMLVETVGGGWWVVPASLVVAVIAAWVVLLVTGPPPDYPDAAPSCRHNLPAWWPSAFPQ